MTQTHWDGWYADHGDEGVSWYQASAAMSLDLVEALGVDPATAVIDVGGGASPLAGELLARGWRDVTVLDLSAAALATAAASMPAGAPVTWVHADVLGWEPPRRYGLWHDRAVFHFLVSPADQAAYASLLRSALDPGGFAIVGTFAADGPEQCSGLPVARWDAPALAGVLGLTVVTERREVHTTPWGASQPFTWIAGVVERP